jgi:uncharacterized protein
MDHSRAERVVRFLLPGLTAARLLFFLTFLGALLAATGQLRAEEPVCGGTNLVEEVREEDPALFRRMKEEAAATPNGEGLLWRVERDEAAPSWLFGTMHMTDPRVTAIPDAVRAALAEAETLAIETTDILDRQAMVAAMYEKPELMMFSEGETLADHLTPEEEETVRKALEARGVPLQAVIKMKPWLIVSLASLPECELKRQQAGIPVLDAKLAEDAKAADKRVTGLETAAEQLSAMASLPLELHIQGLVSTLALGARMDDMIETMIVLYTQGQTGMFRPALTSLMEMGEAEVADYAAFEKRLIEMRNRVMAERSAPLLEEGGAFIAVGAMHLPGETGLVALLREAGYRVERAD